MIFTPGLAELMPSLGDTRGIRSAAATNATESLQNWYVEISTMAAVVPTYTNNKTLNPAVGLNPNPGR